MVFNLLMCASILTCLTRNVASTSCHELQQSQLISLTERMNQMIDTISTLLPKPLKKLPSPVPPTPAPSVDYTPSTGHDMNYYYPQQAYSQLPTTPQIIYVPSPYSPVAAPPAVTPLYPNPLPLNYYTQAEIGPQTNPFSPPTFIPPPPRCNQQYEKPSQVANSVPMPQLIPSTYQPVPYPMILSPQSTEYTHPYPIDYPLPTPMYLNNIPGYPPGVPVFPLPVQVSPGPYALPYHQSTKMQQ